VFQENTMGIGMIYLLYDEHQFINLFWPLRFLITL